VRRETWPLGDLTASERNPRRIGGDAVQRVASSIERYGYMAPLIVTEEGEVIAGHVRLAALREQGVEEVEVLVSELDPQAAAEYRVVDNRAREMTSWDPSALQAELRGFSEGELADYFFPEIDLHVEPGSVDIGEEELEAARAALDQRDEGRPVLDLTCPSCQRDFEVTL